MMLGLSSARIAAPLPHSRLAFIILSHFILKVKAFLKILQHFCVFDDKGGGGRCAERLAYHYKGCGNGIPGGVY